MNDATAALLFGLDQHGASFPTTPPLVAAVAALRAQHCHREQVLVLVAVTLTNADEIADAHGASGLEALIAELGRRALRHRDSPVRLLRASPLGGFLVAVVVDQDAEKTQVEAMLADVRRLVTLPSDDVWPVVTAGATRCLEYESVWDSIRDVRATVLQARDHPGRTRWHLDQTAIAPDAVSLVRDLARAIDYAPEQIALAYQPVQDLSSDIVVGAEALLRWHHPTRGVVRADHAIEAAERTGLIVPLGRLVLEEAVNQAASWLGRFGPDFRMHVNVSPVEFREDDYVDHLATLLYDAGLSPNNLMLEMTETAAISDEEQVRAILFELHELGVGLGIDDFGTGYSSIENLRTLPFDTVKLDRSLVSGIDVGAESFKIVRAVLDLAAALGVTVVAEGIEQAIEASHLRIMGCQFGQGYHLGRPVPATDFGFRTREPRHLRQDVRSA